MNLTRSVTCFFASFLPDTWSQDKQHTQTSDRLECKQKHRAARPTRATLWPVLRLQPSDRHLTVSHDRKYQIEARVGIFTTKWVDLCWFQIKVRSHQRVKVKGAPMQPFCCGSICGSNCVVEDNSSKFNMFKNQFNFFLLRQDGYPCQTKSHNSSRIMNQVGDPQGGGFLVAGYSG